MASCCFVCDTGDVKFHTDPHFHSSVKMAVADVTVVVGGEEPAPQIFVRHFLRVHTQADEL